MTRQGDVIAYADLELEVIEVEGQKIRVATPETLFKRMKTNMPVIKCKTYQEATENLWCFELNTAYYQRLAGFWQSINKLCPRKHPKGIFKYKSTEQAVHRIDERLTSPRH